MRHSHSESVARQTEVAAQVSQKISCIYLDTEQALRPAITVVFIYKICVHTDIWTNTFITLILGTNHPKSMLHPVNVL